MYAYGFRVYFTPLSAVLFAFPSRYWSTIGRQGVFSLGGWSPRLQTAFHVRRLTWCVGFRFRVRGYHPVSPAFPVRSTTLGRSALPRSLAATGGISVDFFSSGYLDVSVPPVRFPPLCVHGGIPLRVGCPIRRSAVHRGVAPSPQLFACSNVLRRLLPPRHPPYALFRLTI